MPRSSATVRRTWNLTDLRISVALGLQHGVNSISLQCIPWPVACSEWGACLTDFRFWGQMTPKVKIFENVFPDSMTGHRNTFCDQISWKSAVAKLPNGRMVYHTQKPCAAQDLSQSPFCPKWADRAQNYLNIVTPWRVHVHRIWSGSAAFCRTYLGKIDFSAQKSQYNKK